jgi:GPH family glycoside/pentoside/hexuronide:cation symporter
VLPLVYLFQGRPIGWTFMGTVTGMIMFVTAMITFLTVHEPQKHRVPEQEAFFKTYASALRSKVFLTALLPWTLHITGTAVIQGALLYYFKYIYRAEEKFQIALVCLLATSLGFIFVWVWISKRIGKKKSYNFGMAFFAVAVSVFFFYGHIGGPLAAFIIFGVAGIGFSTHYVMPHAMVPDVVECDYAENGVRREGVYYALWTFSSKVGQAFALALSGWVLTLFRYVPDQPASELTQLGIRLLCGPISVFFYIAGIVVLSFYPVTQSYYQKVLEKIAVREQIDDG